ncbi:hypothetical protein ACFSTC_46905 [Nonomuraea ferruginea]
MIGEHVIVGYTHDAGGREALALGAAITRVTGGELTVASIYPPGSPGRAVEAQANLAEAGVALEDVPSEYMAFESRGASRGLGGAGQPDQGRPDRGRVGGRRAARPHRPRQHRRPPAPPVAGGGDGGAVRLRADRRAVQAHARVRAPAAV